MGTDGIGTHHITDLLICWADNKRMVSVMLSLKMGPEPNQEETSEKRIEALYKLIIQFDLKEPCLSKNNKMNSK